MNFGEIVKKFLSSTILLLIILLGSTNVFAADYAAVVDDLRSWEVSRIESSHQVLVDEPQSNQRDFFLAVTGLLHSVVNNDGDDIDSISKILNQYGLEFGLTVRDIVPVMDGEVDQFSVSDKSINDFRDFLENWKSNIAYSRGLLLGIPSDFEFNVLTYEGVTIQFDYTDVKVLKSILDLVECGVNYFCAHEFNGTPEVFFTSLSTIADRSDFLYFRTESSGYLANAKTNCVNAIQNMQSALGEYNSEVADLGVEEVVSLSEDAVSALPEIFTKLLESLSSGNLVNFGDETLDTVNLSVLFDASLPLAKILPKFSEEGFYFSSFGHKNGNDATFNGLFPNLTQVLLNRALVDYFEFLPCSITNGASSDVSSPGGQMISGEFQGTVKYLYDWEYSESMIFASDGCFNLQRDSELNLYVQSLDSDFNFEWPDGSYYLVNQDNAKFLFQYPSKDVEIVFNKNGEIYVNTKENVSPSGNVSVNFSYYSNGMNNGIYRRCFIDPSQANLSSLKIVPYPTLNLNFSAIIPGINLLISE